MADAKNSNFAIIQITSPDGRWEYQGSISKEHGFMHIIAIVDHKEEDAYAVEVEADDANKWRTHEDLPIDLRLKLNEEDFYDAIGSFVNAAMETWPTDLEELNSEIDSQETQDITIVPFKNLIKENAFKLSKNQKSFFQTMKYIVGELLEVYGDHSIAAAMEGLFFDHVDESFMDEKRYSTMPTLSANQFNKKMNSVLNKFLQVGDTIELTAPNEKGSRMYRAVAPAGNRYGVKNEETGQEIEPYIGEDGYNYADLDFNGKMIPTRIDKMVLESFKGVMPHDAIGVIHKDGDKTNDELSNLSWKLKE